VAYPPLGLAEVKEEVDEFVLAFGS